MKKTYTTPVCTIERFALVDILCASSIGEGDGAIDTLDDLDNSLNLEYYNRKRE